MEFKRQPSPERMKELLIRSNHPSRMIAKKGTKNLVHCYQKDTEDLILYVRELEIAQGIKPIYLY